MIEKQINNWLRHRFGILCWFLIGYWMLMNGMVYASMLLEILRQTLWSLAAGDFFFQINYDAVYANGWGYAAAIGVTLLILLAWKGGDWFLLEVFRKEKPMRLGIFLGTAVVCIGAQMVNTLWISLLEWLMQLVGGSLMPMLEQVSGATDSFSMFLYSAILAPVMEEILFRGLVFRGLRPYGKRFAIFGSALLFGLFHGNLLQTPYAFLVGLILGWITAEYSALWAIALHVFNNLVLAEGLGRLFEILDPVAAGWVDVIIFGFGTVASVVLLLRSRHQIADYRRSEWMDRRCVKCLLTNFGFLVLAAMALVSMVTMFFAY